MCNLHSCSALLTCPSVPTLELPSQKARLNRGRPFGFIFWIALFSFSNCCIFCRVRCFFWSVPPLTISAVYFRFSRAIAKSNRSIALVFSEGSMLAGLSGRFGGALPPTFDRKKRGKVPLREARLGLEGLGCLTVLTLNRVTTAGFCLGRGSCLRCRCSGNTRDCGMRNSAGGPGGAFGTSLRGSVACLTFSNFSALRRACARACSTSRSCS